MMPRCFDCPSMDVAVKVIDPAGFEHWFCARCWEDLESFRAHLEEMLTTVIANRLDVIDSV